MAFDYQENALSAKVRSLYGKRITEKQFKELCYKGSVFDLIAFLKSHPLYKKDFEEINEASEHISLIENILTKSILEIYPSIAKFSSENSKIFLRHIFFSTECANIAYLVRLISYDQQESYKAKIPSDFMPYAGFDIKSLYNVETYDQLLSALEKTVYYDVLKAVPVDSGGRPNFFFCECYLRRLYYSFLIKTIDKAYKGKKKEELLNLFSQEAELLNLTTLGTIKKLYDVSESETKNLLVNLNFKISPSKLKALIGTKSEQEYYKLLKETPYNIDVSSLSSLEISCDKIINSACKKFVVYRGDNPPLCFSGYILLKNYEIKNLKTIINGLSAGLSAEKIFKSLVI